MTQLVTSNQVTLCQHEKHTCAQYFAYPGLNDVITTQVQAWADTTDNEGLDDTRSISTTTAEVDEQMICDIQRSISRLVGKAPQLIGKNNNAISVCYKVTL